MPKPQKPRRRGAAPVPAARLDAFFHELAQTGSVGTAAENAGVQRSTLYQLRRRNKAFAARWDEALDMGVDRLQDDAITRATVGVERPVFRNGRRIGSVQQFDNRLLQFLLKAHRPETYGDKGRAALPPLPFDLAQRLAAARPRVEAHRAERRAREGGAERRAREGGAERRAREGGAEKRAREKAKKTETKNAPRKVR